MSQDEQNDLFPGSLPKEVGQNDLAKILGITTQRIHQLKAEGLPIAGRGRYPLIESVQWWVNFWKTKNTKESDDLSSHRKRLLKAQAKKAEIDNEERLKELIPAELIASTLNQIGVVIASQLDAIAPRLATELLNQDDAAYIKKVIDDETRHTRNAIADLFDDIANNKNDRDDSSTAADS